MSDDLINQTIDEAKRFIWKAEQALKRLEDDGKQRYFITGTKESGALRRASLDLTRSLSRLRKGGE